MKGLLLAIPEKKCGDKRNHMFSVWCIYGVFMADSCHYGGLLIKCMTVRMIQHKFQLNQTNSQQSDRISSYPWVYITLSS